MPKVGVRIIHGNIEILSECSKSQGAYYTWGHIIHRNLRYTISVTNTITVALCKTNCVYAKQILIIS